VLNHHPDGWPLEWIAWAVKYSAVSGHSGPVMFMWVFVAGKWEYCAAFEGLRDPYLADGGRGRTMLRVGAMKAVYGPEIDTRGQALTAGGPSKTLS
jgi:hypothetical protein